MRILAISLVMLIVSCTWKPVFGQEQGPDAREIFQKPVYCLSMQKMTETINGQGYTNIIRFMTAKQTQLYVYIKNPDFSKKEANRIMIVEAHPTTGWSCLVDEGVGAQFNVDFWKGFLGKEQAT